MSYDLRGISKVISFLPENYCLDAATYLLDHGTTAIITTGFYITKGRTAETDGPPGAIALSIALQRLGWDVTLIVDDYLLPCIESPIAAGLKILSFPLLDRNLSTAYSANLINDISPSVLISIERCGINSNGIYTNMRGVDISEYTPKIDTMFEFGIPSIGIGDGGNEIGMGAIGIEAKASGIHLPWSIIPTDHLIAASVSNWGAYGLLAEVSELTGLPLTPSPSSQAELVKSLARGGAVDGVTGYSAPTVDSMHHSVSSLVLQRLTSDFRQPF